MKFPFGKGIAPIEMIAQILSSLGLRMSGKPIEKPQAEEAFVALAQRCLLPDAESLKLEGTMPDGSRLSGLIVILPPSRAREVSGSGNEINSLTLPESVL